MASVPGACLGIPEDCAEKDLRVIPKRGSKACDSCRRLKIKCTSTTGQRPCVPCQASQRECTWAYVRISREKAPSRDEVDRLSNTVAKLERILDMLEAGPGVEARASSVLEPEDPELQIDSSSTFSTSKSVTAASDIEELVQELSGWQVSRGHYINLDSMGTSRKPDTTSFQTVEQEIRQLMDDPGRSLVERLMEKKHWWSGWSAVNPADFPPAPLAESLVALFFRYVNRTHLILHQGQFLRDWDSGLATYDVSFQALCYAVFAAAARFSEDPTLVNESRHEVGGRYAAACYTCISPISMPCNLYEIQAFAVFAHYAAIACSPLVGWHITGLAVRRGLDVGAHLAEMPRWNTSLMRDQLRKRAFWSLSFYHRQLSASLGWTSMTPPDLWSVDPPLFIDDGHLSRLHQALGKKDAISAKPEWEALASEIPRDQILLSNLISCRFQRQFCRRFAKLRPSRPGCSVAIELIEVRSELDGFLRNDIPLEVRWTTAETDDAVSLALGSLHCMLYISQLIAHRYTLGDSQDETKKCLRAALLVTEVLDHFRSRKLLPLTLSWTPYAIIPTMMNLIYATRGARGLQKNEVARARHELGKCLNVLKELAPMSFLADGIVNSMCALINGPPTLSIQRESIFVSPANSSSATELKKDSNMAPASRKLASRAPTLASGSGIPASRVDSLAKSSVSCVTTANQFSIWPGLDQEEIAKSLRLLVARGNPNSFNGETSSVMNLGKETQQQCDDKQDPIPMGPCKLTPSPYPRPYLHSPSSSTYKELNPNNPAEVLPVPVCPTAPWMPSAPCSTD